MAHKVRAQDVWKMPKGWLQKSQRMPEYCPHLPNVWNLTIAKTKSCRECHGNPKYQPFWASPLSIKHPQDNFSLQNVNWHPPKCKSAPSKKGLATSNLQFLYRTTQKSPLPNLHFGGCQFAVWRLKLSWGCFIEKGGTLKKVGTLAFPQSEHGLKGASWTAHKGPSNCSKTWKWPRTCIKCPQNHTWKFLKLLGRPDVWCMHDALESCPQMASKST